MSGMKNRRRSLSFLLQNSREFEFAPKTEDEKK